MTDMFTRKLTPPEQSFFLLGPRGTGKSTWIRQHFPKAQYYDLLNTAESLRLAREPHQLFREVAELPKQSWVVIDEIQKVPALLDEVHSLIEGKGLRFVLSGSSARKLRRGGSNLLAGRARVETLYPLVSAETGWEAIEKCALEYGTLPMAMTEDDPVGYLTAYAQTYLQEEVRAEALTRNIGDFSRFLEIAARQNAQVTNVAGLSRDAEVSRPTVRNYFGILEDTLLGFWLPPWKLKSATRQVAHPKFYLFDAGVARALSGRLPYPPAPEELGPLMETWILNEVRAYLGYRKRRYPIYYWRTHDGSEVDLFLETRDGYLAVEIKSTTRWDSRYNRSLKSLRNFLGAKPLRSLGVFLGEKSARWDEIHVLPARQFLQQLWSDELIP
jgi:predicted AAA+ superfamily ATPase